MPFDLQPVLKGQLLELRPLRPDDFDALYAVARDPLIGAVRAGSRVIDKGGESLELFVYQITRGAPAQAAL